MTEHTEQAAFPPAGVEPEHHRTRRRRLRSPQTDPHRPPARLLRGDVLAVRCGGRQRQSTGWRRRHVRPKGAGDVCRTHREERERLLPPPPRDMAHAPLVHAECVGAPRGTQLARALSDDAAELGAGDRERHGHAEVLAD